MTLTDLLTQLESLDVQMGVHDGNLRLNAPKGVLTLELQREIKAHKAEMLCRLTAAVSKEEEEAFEPQPISSEQEFLETVKRIGDAIAQSTQQDWAIGLIRPDYTLEQHIDWLHEQEREAERAGWRVARKAQAYVGLPKWLRPGTDDWNAQVTRNGLEEMQQRRKAWFAQQSEQAQL